MIQLINQLLSAARSFTVGDFFVLKMLLCCIGIILGMYFSDFFLNHKTIVWIVTIVLWFIMLIRILAALKKQNTKNSKK